MAFRSVRSTAFLAGLLALAPVPVLALTLRVMVECPDCPASSPVTAALRWEPEAPAEADQTSAAAAGSIETSIPGTVDIDLDPEIVWSLQLVAEGWWSPVTKVSIQPPPQPIEPVRIRVSPAGEIEGQALLQDGSPVSEVLDVELAEAPGEGRAAPAVFSTESGAHTADCEVDAEGRFRCQVPAGLLDLRLRAPGTASEFRWGVPVGRREVVSLGEIQFVPGASVVGFLTAEDVRDLPGSAWVELSPLTEAPAASAARTRLHRLTQTVLPDVRGLFRFPDLRPGAYRLVAGADGFTETTLSPIQVQEGRESMLREPLTLRRPARLEVWLSPPVDADGQPWRLSLHPRDSPRGRLLEPRTGVTGIEGRWLQTDLLPGLYQLSVEGGDHGRWHDEEVEVTAPETSIEVSLPLVQVTGRVTRDDEPIPSLLLFGGRQGSQQVRLHSDEDGEFEGILPRAGEWPLEVVTDEDGTVQELDPVEVVKTSDGSPTVLEIEIPDTLLAGKVTDGQGEPVVGAMVTARRTDRASMLSSLARTGADGEFSFHGLAEGGYLVSAERLDASRPLGIGGQSPGVEATVREKRPVRDVELVLDGRKTLRGVVLSTSGPVAGAWVAVWPRTKYALGGGSIDDRVTGPTGEVEADVPDSTIGVTVILDPPGFPTSFDYVPIAGNGAGTLHFQVAEAGGHLVVVIPQTILETWPGLPILHHEGAFVPLSAMGARGRQERLTDPELGEVVRWTHPSIAYGSYALCPSAFLDQRCVSGYLQPQGELVLDIAANDRSR